MLLCQRQLPWPVSQDAVWLERAHQVEAVAAAAELDVWGVDQLIDESAGRGRGGRGVIEIVEHKAAASSAAKSVTSNYSTTTREPH